jgi:hypothetical protein
VSWSGWPDLNRRPLRPEAKSRYLLPALQHACPGNHCPSVSAGVRCRRRASLLTWLLGSAVPLAGHLDLPGGHRTAACIGGV